MSVWPIPSAYLRNTSLHKYVQVLIIPFSLRPFGTTIFISILLTLIWSYFWSYSNTIQEEDRNHIQTQYPHMKLAFETNQMQSKYRPAFDNLVLGKQLLTFLDDKKKKLSSGWNLHYTSENIHRQQLHNHILMGTNNMTWVEINLYMIKEQHPIYRDKRKQF